MSNTFSSLRVLGDQVMSRVSATSTVLLLLLLFQSTAVANTYYVPEQFSAIQSALDAAADGDTIIVGDGRYTGVDNKDLDFNGKALTLRSENGPHRCIIDCEDSGSGFFFHRGESGASAVEGFSIINGGASGIVCEFLASPSIRNCIISGNSANPNGGGIYCAPNTSPTLTNCTITGNSARYGGAIFCDQSELSVMNCIFWNNSAMVGGEIYLADMSSLTISYSTIRGGRPCIYVERSCLLDWGYGNVEAEPFFMDEVGADYHLKSSSPCVDAGDPASDCSREPLPNGGIINMGAYGNTSEAAITIGLAEEDDKPVDDDDDSGSEFFCLFRSSLHGSPYGDKLDILRKFRDRFLAPYVAGRILTRFYYRISPPMSKRLHRSTPLRVVTRAMLIPVVWFCEILVRTPDRVFTHMGFGLGGVVFAVSTYVRRKYSRRTAGTRWQICHKPSHRNG